MLLAFSLEISKFLPLLLNLLEQCLARFWSVLHPTKYWLNIEQVPDLPSILSKLEIYPMPVIRMTGKPAKEKSPVGEHPTGLRIKYLPYLIRQ